MEANEQMGTFVRCNWKSGGFSDFPEDCWERLAGCITGGTGGWVEMDTCVGATTVFDSGNVASVQLSTPEARRAAYDRDELWESLGRVMAPPEWG